MRLGAAWPLPIPRAACSTAGLRISGARPAGGPVSARVPPTTCDGRFADRDHQEAHAVSKGGFMATKFWLASIAVKRSKDEPSIKPYSDVNGAFCSNFSGITIPVKRRDVQWRCSKGGTLAGPRLNSRLGARRRDSMLSERESSDQLAKLNQPALSCAGRRGRRTAKCVERFRRGHKTNLRVYRMPTNYSASG